MAQVGESLNLPPHGSGTQTRIDTKSFSAMAKFLILKWSFLDFRYQNADCRERKKDARAGSPHCCDETSAHFENDWSA